MLLSDLGRCLDISFCSYFVRNVNAIRILFDFRALFKMPLLTFWYFQRIENSDMTKACVQMAQGYRAIGTVFGETKYAQSGLLLSSLRFFIK